MNNTGNGLAELPMEIFRKCFMYLAPEDLYNCWNCCKKWRDFLSSPRFWREKCQRDQIMLEKEDLRSKLYNTALKCFSTENQAKYMYNVLIQKHWENEKSYLKICQPAQLKFSLHYSDYEVLIAGVFSVSDKRESIHVINMFTGKILSEFLSYGKIAKIVRHKNLIVGAIEHYAIQVWDLPTSKCVLYKDLRSSLINSHESLQVHKNLVMYINEFESISILDSTNNGSIVHRNSDVICFCYIDEKIFVGTNRKNIEIMSLDSNLPVQSLVTNTVIQNIEFRGNSLIGFSQNPDEDEEGFEIFGFNIGTQQQTFRLKGIEYAKFINETKLCIALFKEPLIVIADLLERERPIVIEQEMKGFIASNSRYLFIGSLKEKFVTMWSVRTGRFIRKLEFGSDIRFNFLVTETKMAYVEISAAPGQKDYIVTILDYDHNLESSTMHSYPESNRILDRAFR